MQERFLTNPFYMKYTILLIAFFSWSYTYAQDLNPESETSDGGFKKENLFTGGGLQLSFANSTFVGGISPVFGYSINKWIDAGVLVNFTYASNNHVIYVDGYGNYTYSDDRLRQTIFGPGAFVKFYPIKFLFLQAQGEFNFITEKYFPVGGPNQKENHSVPSLLVGAGFAGSREGIRSFFYQISLSFDVLRRPNSPYTETLRSGHVSALPIIRAGIQVPLFNGGGNRY